MIKAKATKDRKSKVLRDAEDLVVDKAEQAYLEDLVRTGVVWAGILELTDPISPSEVAALLCAHDLVRATRLVESESHWVSAAAYAALGAYAEPAEAEVEKIEKIEQNETPHTIGFVASAKSQS
ncbi:hypothetical protein [Actinomycetia phage DSL-LC01]|nr:hypothetical protein [Actinomycetia phage DSL-LC01]